MNAYAKIGIKIAVVVVVVLVLLFTYNMLGRKAFRAAERRFNRQYTEQEDIRDQWDQILAFQEYLPQIRQVQLQDMQTIHNLIPVADEFVLTSYLRLIHNKLADNHLETNGIVIGGGRAPVGGTNFEEAFSSEVLALQEDLERITDALNFFEQNIGEMDNLLTSFRFYQIIGTGKENFGAIAGGIVTHSFSLSVRGSYEDIKKFTFDIYNMRPHTALVGFQMSPQPGGFGATRQYSANFTLFTYGDGNTPPPLWSHYMQGLQADADEAVEMEEGEDLDVSEDMENTEADT